MVKSTVYLFTSPTCPHCPPAKAFIEEYKKGRTDFELKVMSTVTQEGLKKAREFEIMTVPTFIIVGEGYPQPIGLKGIQSKKDMDKYIDLSLGNE